MQNQIFKPELNLLISCLRLFLENESIENLKKECDKITDWKEFINLAEYHKVSQVIYKTLCNCNEEIIPQKIFQILKDKVELKIRWMLLLTSELARIADILNKANIPVTALKGPVMAKQLYHDITIRYSKDIDLLVAEKYIEDADKYLQKAGYKRTDSKTVLSSRQINSYINTFNHFVYFNKNNKVILELHWHLQTPPGIISYDIESIWDILPYEEIAGVCIKTMPLEDNFLYLCEHGAKHYWFRLCWLLDIAVILNNYNIDWQSIEKKVKYYNAQRLVSLAIFIANQLFRTPVPAFAKKHMIKDKKVDRIADIAFQFIHHNISNPAPFSGFYKLRKYYKINLSQKLSYKLKYLFRHFRITPKDYEMISLPDLLFPLYYFLKPFAWFLRAIKQRQTETSKQK